MQTTVEDVLEVMNERDTMGDKVQQAHKDLKNYNIEFGNMHKKSTMITSVKDFLLKKMRSIQEPLPEQYRNDFNEPYEVRLKNQEKRNGDLRKTATRAKLMVLPAEDVISNDF
jgi:hypothetical protein